MGVYTEYLDRRMNFQQITEERKKQLQRISDQRGGNAILVYAANITLSNVPIGIGYDDLLPFTDQIGNLKGDKLDLILETPGGSGEVAEDIVRILRDRFSEINVIVPGWAKSAGTIMAMAADEILMGPGSALGPIDAQLTRRGNTFSADALISEFEEIKKEVTETGVLNKTYIPILQGISLGELSEAENQLAFAKTLVAEWLARYKFKNWMTHSSTGNPVTSEERKQRAEEIAADLANHSKWRTHGRSIRIDDLREMHLQITDYSGNQPLADAIHRYHTLLQMTFAAGIFKIFETPLTQVYRAQGIQQAKQDAQNVVAEGKCNTCGRSFKVQANLEPGQPTLPGTVPYPKDDKLNCPQCNAPIDLSGLKRQIEAATGKKVVTE